MRVSHLLRAAATLAALAALALPVASAAQSLATMPLTSQSPEAIAMFREGITHLVMIHPRGAARHFRAAVEKDSAFALARAYLANTDASLTRDQKLAEIERALAHAAKATTTELLLMLQARAQVTALPGENRALARAAKALLPDEPAYWLADLAPGTRPQDAIVRWREATTKFPESALALNSYAYTAWAAGDRKGALDAARRQVERFGQHPNPHDTYAELLAWNGDLDGAATHYGHALAAAPDFTEAHVGLAEVAVMRFDMARARSELQRAIERAPGPAVRLGHLRQLASTFALEANREATRNALTNVADVAAANGETDVLALVTAQLAALHGRLGHADSAHALATRASALRPRSQGVLYFTAMSHALLGHEAPARAAIAAARAQPGGDASPAKDRLLAVEGYMAIRAERPKDALSVLQKADTADLVVLSWIAEANSMLGSAAKATAQFTRIRDDRELDLLDYAAVNARARAAMALAPRAATRR